MELILIVLYVFLNLVAVYVYYKREIGIFQAPFLLASVSLTVILPQLTTIYSYSFYRSELLFLLCYTMITGNLFFFIGFELGKRKKMPIKIVIFKSFNLKYLTAFFALCGFISFFLWKGSEESGDFVISYNLKLFSQVAMLLSFILLFEGKRDKLIFFSLLLSVFSIFYFAFFVKGSRFDSFMLFTSILFFLSLLYPKKRNYLKVILILFLFFGSVVSSSIGDFRESLLKKNSSNMSIFEIDYLENFKKSFTNSYSPLGMDLGNAALGIDYCYLNSSYDYGLQIWNGFIYFYVPRRVFGASFKESLYFSPSYRKVVQKYTHNVTTMTGYFSSFAAFSVFGFVLFMFLGFTYGVFWQYMYYSNFCMFVYVFTLSQVPFFLTHGIQYFFGAFEFLFIFLLPFYMFFLKRIKIRQ